MQVLDLKYFGEALVTLFVIMDPLGTIPLFLALTSAHDARARSRAAWQAVAVAFGVIVVFAVAGRQIMDFLGISIPSLQIAGGLLLLLVALDLLTGKAEAPTQVRDVNIALVPLGTPLLAGPGAIVAAIVFTQRADEFRQFSAVALAIVAIHLILYATLRFSGLLQRVLGKGGILVTTRIAGLLLSAIAVQLVATGIASYVHDY